MNKASCHMSTIQNVHCTEGGGVEGDAHGQINYIDTKAKCFHVKKIDLLHFGLADSSYLRSWALSL